MPLIAQDSHTRSKNRVRHDGMLPDFVHHDLEDLGQATDLVGQAAWSQIRQVLFVIPLADTPGDARQGRDRTGENTRNEKDHQNHHDRRDAGRENNARAHLLLHIVYDTFLQMLPGGGGIPTLR